jgi:hypothetical protein
LKKNEQSKILKPSEKNQRLPVAGRKVTICSYEGDAQPSAIARRLERFGVDVLEYRQFVGLS